MLRNFYYYLLSKKKKRYLQMLINRGLNLGENVDIIDSFFFDPSHCFLITIGDNCTICPNVRLIAHDASTKKLLGYTKIGKITIGDNCFLGDSVIVLPSVSIGDNTIIGAGAIVTTDIPPDSIAAGNPARPIADVASYIAKIEVISSQKRIFDERYFIENLDREKKAEMLASIGNSIGFIV